MLEKELELGGQLSKGSDTEALPNEVSTEVDEIKGYVKRVIIVTEEEFSDEEVTAINVILEEMEKLNDLDNFNLNDLENIDLNAYSIINTVNYMYDNLPSEKSKKYVEKSRNKLLEYLYLAKISRNLMLENHSDINNFLRNINKLYEFFPDYTFNDIKSRINESKHSNLDYCIEQIKKR